MATIELTDVLFYKGGSSGVSKVVGNDWENDATISRVARYTFTAPETGALRLSMKFHVSGVGDGDAIPIRYYIGTDPDSHADAGPESPYTGELTLADDWLSLSGAADAMLLPGKTYYLWVFPGSEDYGWYTWNRLNYTAALELSGAALVLPVVRGGAWKNMMLCVVRGGKWYLLAPCAVRDGKWHYLGASG